MRKLILAAAVCFAGCADREPATALLEPCIACGESVSIEANTCPDCGQRNPTKARRLAAQEATFKAVADEYEAEQQAERDAMQAELNETKRQLFGN
jgi:hypothetical protein